jgi:DNA-binding XRE family transcriptional regulator
MAQKRKFASHIRTHRKRSGFTQRELAALMGHSNAVKVWRHEQGITLPSLADALRYGAIFRVPVAQIFPTIQEAVSKDSAIRLTKLETALGKKTSRDRNGNATAQKLRFISAWKNGIEI